ncbi:hypothetical protein [Yersinia similis]|uniref:hypothetical protein n=1 Tax=Yersinia similis TaxID=367190 RepID=UPI0011A8D82E|nr:hypothetical protein [Yersinia similis]
MSIIDWADISFKIGVPVATGLIVAYGTAKYALYRFYKEKWWEKRLSAFLEVIEHAYNVKRADEYWLAASEYMGDDDDTFKSLSEEDNAKLKDEHDLAMKEIIRISHLASFTLSQNTSIFLETYIKEHKKIYSSWWVGGIIPIQANQKSSEIIDTLFQGLLAEAKRVLNLPK